MRSYRLAAFAAAFLAVAAAGLFAPPAQPARAQGRYVPPPPCACRHLPDLQAELRNALLLERRMRAQAERLRT
jgi:hypothetical protein